MPHKASTGMGCIMDENKPLVPALRTLLWFGAIALCALLILGVVKLRTPRTGAQHSAITGGDRSETKQVHAQAGTTTLPSEPQEASQAVGPTSKPNRPEARHLTEELFVEISAHMARASTAFSDTEKGREAYEQACQDILRQHGVSWEAFDKMQTEIVSDPQRHERILDLIEAKIAELDQPKNVRVTTGPPGARPSRPSPTSR